VVSDDDNNPVSIFGFSRDITDALEAEAERLSLERQVQHAQKLESLGVLAGGIAHDFNNLLTSILGNANLALEDLDPSSPSRAELREIDKATRRAADLCGQMLAYSGRGSFVLEPIHLGQLVQEMAHLLQASISKRAALRCDLPQELPLFEGDATQIRQVVMNLITNASEAVGEQGGQIVLSTGYMSCDRAYLDAASRGVGTASDPPLAEGTYVYLEVTDSGCGMDSVTLSKLFDPFFTTKFTGRGLGMSAVQGIMRGHKAALSVSSEPGEGTHFQLLFPSTRDGALATQPRPQPPPKTEWRGSGTILLVDDDEAIRWVSGRMLERAGFNVLTACDGLEGVEVFVERADDIDCVLLDLTMPRMDGGEALENMRRHRPDVTVIVCSGYQKNDAIGRFGGNMPAAFLQKPYDFAALVARLEEVLGDAVVRG
jgi:two-component system, cell cycle sensor histidine kinase and response regulator CckA